MGSIWIIYGLYRGYMGDIQDIYVGFNWGYRGVLLGLGLKACMDDRPFTKGSAWVPC